MNEEQLEELKLAEDYLTRAFYELDGIYGLESEKQEIINELAQEAEIILDRIEALRVSL